MESHPPVHRTRVLKLQPNCCTECVRKVKRAMLKVEGVHSVQVNAKEGTIQVKSEIDPQVLIEMAAKAGKRAELLWEPLPGSSGNISTAAPPPPIATPQSTGLAQARVFDSFDHAVHLQDLVDQNAPGIKHMEIIDKRVIKITFKESHDHDDPTGNHSSEPNPSGNDRGTGGATGSGGCGNVQVVAAAPEPPGSLLPTEIIDAPCNSKPTEPPVANVNCSNGRTSCRVM